MKNCEKNINIDNGTKGMLNYLIKAIVLVDIEKQDSHKKTQL